MKKLVCIVACIFQVFVVWGQQTVQYSQYMLNNLGLNPAATGISPETEILFGRRTQWLGFEGAPEITFAALHKGLGKSLSRNYWHGAGIYIEQDKAGLFTSKHIQGSYAFHLMMSKRKRLSFGMAAGMKIYSFSDPVISSDPVFSSAPYSLILFPDISAGLKFYARKLTLDLSARQLYKTQASSAGKRMGLNSRLLPHFYLTLSRRFTLENYYFSFLPSIHIKSSPVMLPSVTLGSMAIFKERIGAGIYFRVQDAVYGVVQVRIIKNVIAGFSYEYALSPFNSIHARTAELMIGISPSFSNDLYKEKPNLLLCPMFSH